MSAHTPGPWEFYEGPWEFCEDNNYGGTVNLGPHITVSGEGGGMSAHTPGPWEENDDDGVIHGADGIPVCEVTAPGPSKADLATANANSHLIAAAPDLLAALKKWAECVATEDAAAQCAAWHEFEDAARAAIAKAEGKS